MGDNSEEKLEDDDGRESPQYLFQENEEGHVHALRRSSTNASVHTTMSVQSQEMMARIMTELPESKIRHENETSLPKMGAGKDYPPELPDRDAWRVDFDGPDDPNMPTNWPLKRKILAAAVLAFTSMTSTWTSAIFSVATPKIMEEFGFAEVVATLTTSLYVLGYGLGIIWGPASELYGRKLPIVVSLIGFTSLNFGAATAKDFQTLAICRFFAGICSAAPLAIVAAAFSDLFTNYYRGTAMIVFAATVFCGPLMGPVAGGFIQPAAGWRMLLYLCGMMSGLSLILVVLFLQETFPPVLLARKATELRQRTGNWGIYAPHEIVELDIRDIVTKNLTRPLVLLCVEPTILLMTTYTAFVYGILYLTLTAYPIIFGPEGYDMPGGVADLPFIGIVIGVFFSVAAVILYFEPLYVKALKRNGDKPVPEMRLLPMMTGAVVFPIGLFWLFWSGNYYESVHWAVPTCSGVAIGYGLLSIFLPALNYIIDSYLLFAASAIAANTMLRSTVASALPLVGGFLFRNLGKNWGGTLVGCLGVLLAPVPVLFYIFGRRIRQRSKYAFDLD